MSGSPGAEPAGPSLDITFVIARYPPATGGTEIQAAALAGALRGRGHRVRVLTQRLPGISRAGRRRGDPPSPGRRRGGGLLLLRLPGRLRPGTPAARRGPELPPLISVALRRCRCAAGRAPGGRQDRRRGRVQHRHHVPHQLDGQAPARAHPPAGRSFRRSRSGGGRRTGSGGDGQGTLHGDPQRGRLGAVPAARPPRRGARPVGRLRRPAGGAEGPPHGPAGLAPGDGPDSGSAPGDGRRRVAQAGGGESWSSASAWPPR